MGRQINSSERLNGQRCSGWDALAHYHVFCLRMDAVPHPSIHPSVHPYIHPLWNSVSQLFMRETDTHTYPETGTRGTKIGTNVCTQKQRCIDTETETEQTLKGKRDRGGGKN